VRAVLTACYKAVSRGQVLSLQLKITGTVSFQIADRPGSGLAYLVVSRITRRLAECRVACGHADISIRGETRRQSKCRCTVDTFARQREGTPLRPSAHKGVCIERALWRFHAHLFGGQRRYRRFASLDSIPPDRLKQRNEERHEHRGRCGDRLSMAPIISLSSPADYARILTPAFFRQMTNPKRGHPLRLGPKTAPLGSGDGAGCLTGSKQIFDLRVQRPLSLGLRR
jgi:hypothetical protein